MANETKIIISAVTAQAEAALAKLGVTAGNVTRNFFDLSGVAAGLTGALSIAGFAAFIKGSIDAADELNNLSIKTGTTVENLAGLKYAAEQNDTSLQAVAGAAKKLSTALVDKPELFAKLGITAKDSTGALVQMADIFAAMPDGAEKTALAVKLMGKSGEEMIPLLNNGGGALRAMIDEGQRLIPISGETARQAAQFNDQMDKMSTLAGGFGIQAANGILPAMNDIVALAIKGQQEYGTLYGILVAIGGAVLKVGGVEISPEKRRDNRIDQLLKQRGRLNQDIADPAARGGLYDPAGFKAEAQAELARVNAELKALVAEKNAQIARDGQAAEAKRLAADKASQVKASDFNGGGNGKSAAERLREQEQQTLDSLQRQAAGYSQLSEVEQLRYDIAAGKYKGFSESKLREMELLAQQVDQNKAAAEADKQAKKDKEQAARDHAKAVEEANRIIFDVDPQRKANAEWERLQELQKQVGKEMLSDEMIGKAYAKSFEDINKSGNDTFASLEQAVRGWGDSFTNSMVDMMHTGKVSFSSLADSILRDIERIVIQTQITQPLLDGLFGKGYGTGGNNKMGGLLGDLFKGGSSSSGSGLWDGIKGFFGFADGGIMSSAGPLPLNKYANGGIARSPQLALFGEGRMNEAFVPLPDGRSIPVSLRGAGAQSGATIHITNAPVIQIDSRTDQAEVYKLVQNAVAHGNAQLVDRLQRQGALA